MSQYIPLNEDGSGFSEDSYYDENASSLCCYHNQLTVLCDICNRPSTVRSSSPEPQYLYGNHEQRDYYFQPTPSQGHGHDDQNDPEPNHWLLQENPQPWSTTTLFPEREHPGERVARLGLPENPNPQAEPQYPEEIAGIEDLGNGEASDVATFHPLHTTERGVEYGLSQNQSYQVRYETGFGIASDTTSFDSQRIPHTHTEHAQQQTSAYGSATQHTIWDRSAMTPYLQPTQEQEVESTSDLNSSNATLPSQDDVDQMPPESNQSRDESDPTDTSDSAPTREACPICGKNVKSIRSHMRRHDKKFRCAWCGKMFSDSRDLHRHELKHIDRGDSRRAARSAKCRLCGMVLTRKDNRDRHERSSCKNRLANDK